MKFLNRDIKLAIFDLDGTLLDSTSIWSDIDQEFFHKRGMEIPPNYTAEIAHLGLEKAALWTKIKYCPEEEASAILKEWKDMSLKAYQEDIKEKPYAKELLEKLKNNGVHLAIATANSKELYEPCLKRLGIDMYFDFVIDVNSVKQGKTSSEIYDKTAERFNLHKDNIMIVEDLLEAMVTAFKAGYLTIGVYDEMTTKDIEKNKKNCHFFAVSLHDILKLL